VKLLTILLVEDSRSDAILISETLSESKLLNVMHHVKDGVEASDFLFRRGAFAESPRPDLILLDLNLPRKNGQELLEEIKSDEGLKTIPVVILTTSSDEIDILRSYQLHANCYLTKPVDLDSFVHVVKSIEQFWLALVHFPPQG
jgi:two-component system response regulator